MRRRRGTRALTRAAAAGRGAALRGARARRGGGAARPPTATAGVAGLLRGRRVSRHTARRRGTPNAPAAGTQRCGGTVVPRLSPSPRSPPPPPRTGWRRRRRWSAQAG